jgi:hypothetical protein
MSLIVNLFYCYNCEKDVKTKIESSVSLSGSYLAVVSISAVCCDCGTVIVSKESEPIRLP